MIPQGEQKANLYNSFFRRGKLFFYLDLVKTIFKDVQRGVKLNKPNMPILPMFNYGLNNY